MPGIKKILVTGSTGFIGKNLTEQLQLSYDIFSPTSKQLNLFDESQVKKYLLKNKFDAVLHCATHNGTKVSNKDLSLVFKNNLKMFFNLARCNNLYKRMFYFGSGAEYDMRNYIPKMKENYFDSYIPIDDYGFSKYIMSKYIKSTPNIYDLRLFGVFGKYEDWRIRFISQSICRAIFNKDITINKNVFFDYLYIDDLVKIIKILIEKKTIPSQHINVCTGITIDLISLAKIVVNISDKKIKIEVLEEGFKKEYSGDNSKLTEIIGDYKFTNEVRAIDELYSWYFKNKKIINKKYL